MPLYNDPKSPFWYIVINIDGKRIRRSSGTTDKREAQRLHDKIKAGLWQRKGAGITWHDACVEWLNASTRNESDRYRLRSLLRDIPNIPLNELTASTIEPHLSSVPSTYNREANLITAILSLAKRRGHIDTVPAIERKKVSESRIRWLTQNEWQKLYASLPDHLKPIARFSIATGLRRGNATHLEWSQVDLRRKVAWIHADQAKAGKPIGIPLSDDAMEVLRSQLGQNDTWVFPYKGKPLGEIKGAWKRALKRAGIENFRWHDLRHTWATWHIQAGTPLAVLQKLGGWATHSMVLRYAHFAPDHLAGYANNAKPYPHMPEKMPECA